MNISKRHKIYDGKELIIAVARFKNLSSFSLKFDLIAKYRPKKYDIKTAGTTNIKVGIILSPINEPKTQKEIHLDKKCKVTIVDETCFDLKANGKTIAVFFTSTNQDIHRPISCKNIDTFVRIEEKIYNEYPKYKDYNTYLTVNGNTIKRFKTFDENKIKDGDTIIVNIYDE